MAKGTVRVDDGRLSIVESKLDRIVERLEALIRLEERHDGAVKRIDRHDERLDRHAERLGALEADASAYHQRSNIVERFLWIVVSAVVGLGAYFARGG